MVSGKVQGWFRAARRHHVINNGTGCSRQQQPCSHQLLVQPRRWWHAAAASPTSGASLCRSGLTRQSWCCRRGWSRCGAAAS